MLVTAYGRVTDPSLTTESALNLLRSTYAEDPFVVVVDEPPTLKDPVGSNLCFVSARVDARTGWLIAMSSIDNLIKGAAVRPSKPERREWSRRDLRAPDDRRDAVNCVVVKLGGHALDSLAPSSSVLIDLAHDVANSRTGRERRGRARRRTADRCAARSRGLESKFEDGLASPTRDDALRRDGPQ